MIHDDPVNHPAHCTSDPSGVECIQITRHRNFNIGNAIKYLWRAGLKQEASQTHAPNNKEIEDLNKAIWYITDEIKRLGGTVTVQLQQPVPPIGLSLLGDLARSGGTNDAAKPNNR